MKRLLRNLSASRVHTTYHGRPYVIEPKATIVLDHNGDDEQAADFLLQTYGFLREEKIQTVPPPVMREVLVKNHKGKVVKKNVHVFKKAIPKGGKHI